MDNETPFEVGVSYFIMKREWHENEIQTCVEATEKTTVLSWC